MKKIIGVLMLGVLLVGCGAKITEEKPEAIPTKEEVKTDVFTTIKEAVTKSLPLKCDYVDEDGETTTVYFKGQVVKLVGGAKDGVKFEGLIKDKKFYLWDANKKTGMELDLAVAGADGSMTMGGKPVKGTDDVVATLEEKKSNCSVVTAEAAMFEVPTDVKFTNTEDLLK